MGRAVAIALGIVVVLAIAWGALHVLITPVNPEQVAPEGHSTASCWACHLVMSSADLVDVE